jgi:hypothetical protein
MRFIVPGVVMVERLVDHGDKEICSDAGDAVSTEPCAAAMLVPHTLSAVEIVAGTLVAVPIGSYTTASRSSTPDA